MRDRQASVERVYRELRDSDPELFAEMESVLHHRAPTPAGMSIEEPGMVAEAIILTVGRPVLDIKAGQAVVELTAVESRIWRERLSAAANLIAPNIPAVGRIELVNHPRGVSWIGSGWLIRDNIVVTNRHVAEIFAEASGAEFVFRPGFDGSPMRANIDFLEEFENQQSHEFPLFKILHIERGGGPDLAFLRIEPPPGMELPQPVTLATNSPDIGEQVAVIGYPARDPFFPNQELMRKIFNDRFDKKRLAPGLVTGKSSDRLFHDCSTLGGNSGGQILSLKSGRAIALHFAGTLFSKNHAVPIDIVAQRLDDVLQRRSSDSPIRPDKPPAKPMGDADLSSAPTTLPDMSPTSRVIEAVIPIKVRIEIGDVAAGPPCSTGPAIFNPDADDDLIETIEARAEDYRDRVGYAPDFLGDGFEVPLPWLTEHQADLLEFAVDGRTESELRYHHFSVVMSKSRRLCRFSAVNLDGKQSKRSTRGGWQLDPRIPKSAQIIKECYGNPPKFSRGHMTRREDPAWGKQADLGNRDSMHVTNAVPQLQAFNGSMWLNLEDYALEHARRDDMRISVFTGPFLASTDPLRYGVKIPVSFWKVIAFIHDETGELCATGYTMSQKSFLRAEREEFVFGRHENNQCPIHEIERRAGISFGPLAEVDPLREDPEFVSSPLTHPSQLRFR